ncbi:preprotein translocase subunit SecG [Candidatus Cytomitobacter indipagum]|uniref:Protein-export membrane protein SecG n=1 Tax=Candidatus Cytomitobacter indipagum TaxID=2601575 RepID=A0A5C0UDW5_9PROT|nr:preprotein translocase subunit SecG [Candidatus Cytomitobacter indipagum]QEK38256.1 preprotein translocase subunit SecG [Candidatus Cytomitobacter indipagum]
MLSVVWSIYLVVVLSLSILVFLQKGEDAVSMSQSKFMTPRAMSTFLTKLTYFLYGMFVFLCLVIGIMIKKQKIALNKEFETETSVKVESNAAEISEYPSKSEEKDESDSDEGKNSDSEDDSSGQIIK